MNWLRCVGTSVLGVSLSCGQASAPRQELQGKEDKLARRPESKMAAAAPAAPAEADAYAETGRSRSSNESTIGSPAKTQMLGSLGGCGAGGGKLAELESALEGGDKAAPPRAPRSWFPETFLWIPMIDVEASGGVEATAKVPDRLTTWRVLALAHDRAGSQAGTEIRFLGTLPVYVDPVVPAFLVQGDEIQLPIQIVNTTDAAVEKPLVISVKGAAAKDLRTRVKLAPKGAVLEFLRIQATKVGTVEISVALGDADTVEKSFPVLAAGRPVRVAQSGTLSALREFSLTTPDDTLAAGARATLTVVPGARSLLRLELASSITRGGPAEDAYALLLAGRGKDLLEKLGEHPNLDELRKNKIVATQRVVRHARVAELAESVLFAEAALSHPADPILQRLSERMVDTALAAQRPDGTFGGETGFTLQRLLVTTAEAVAVVGLNTATPVARQRAQGSRLRASGAFERYLGQVDDAYTAAALLASGSLSGTLADTLRERVVKAVVTRDDGSKVLPVPEGVVRSDGQTPSEAESTALAARALYGGKAEDKALSVDLGGSVMAAYQPLYGWGDGRANLTCLRTILEIFRDPLPDSVSIIVERDGVEVMRDVLTKAMTNPSLVFSAEVTKPAGTQKWSVRPEPPTPGLGYSLELSAFAPWKSEGAKNGLELQVKVGPTSVGQKALVELTAAAPADATVRLEVPLPAGVSGDEGSLQALMNAGAITSFESEDGRVAVVVPPREPGRVIQVSFLASATLAGRLHAAAPSIQMEGQESTQVHVLPPEWLIK